MVVVVLPALVLEAGIEDLLDLLGYYQYRLILPDVDPESVVGPAYLQDVVFGPERLKWGPDSGLDLEVVRHVLVLDDAQETLRGEDPHHDPLPFESTCNNGRSSHRCPWVPHHGCPCRSQPQYLAPSSLEDMQASGWRAFGWIVPEPPLRDPPSTRLVVGEGAEAPLPFLIVPI